MQDRLDLASMAALGCRSPECVRALDQLDAERTRVNFRQFVEFCDRQALAQVNALRERIHQNAERRMVDRLQETNWWFEEKKR